MPPSVHSKTSYRVASRLDRFYTGGSVCASVDEESVVCACGDEVKVVHIASGDTQRTFPGDAEPITALAVSPNGSHIFTASQSLTNKAWELGTGKCFRTWKAHNAPTTAMAVDASGALVASASAAHEIRVWDVPGGFCTHSFSGHSGIILCVIFHTRELLLATSGDDGAVILWDLVTKKRRVAFNGHVSAVTALAWTPDHWGLVAGGRDSVVTLWDVRTNEKVRTIAVFDAVETLVVLPHTALIPGVGRASDPRACFFGTGGEAGQVKFWDSRTGRCVHTHHPTAGSSHAREIVELMLLPKSGRIVVATADCHVAQYQVAANELSLERMLLGNADEVTALCFAGSLHKNPGARPDGQDHGSGHELSGVTGRDFVLPHAVPQHIVVATNSAMLHVLSTGSMSCEATLAGHQDNVLALAVTQVHGCWVAVSGSKDKSLRLWSLASQHCLAVGQGHIGDVTAVSFAAKAAPVVVSGGADKLVRVWDTSEVFAALEESGAHEQDAALKQLWKLKVSATVAAHDKEVNCVAVAPNNKLMASGGADRCAKLWQLPALSAPMVLRGHKRGVMDICFAPIDQAVLTASSDATIRLWSVRNGACLKTFSGHSSAVLQAAFISTGTQIMSAGSDGLLKLWTVATGENVSTFEAHDDKIWALDVGGENDSVVLTGAADGSLALWADVTKLDQETANAAMQEQLRQQQDLDNAVMDKNYLRASKLAFRLKKPGRLLSIVSAILSAPAELDAAPPGASAQVLTRLVASFNSSEVAQAFQYLRDWNATARHCHCAQALLHALLTTRSTTELMASPGMQDVSHALILYTERHFKRMDRHLQSAFLLDYLLRGMHVYEDDAADAATDSRKGWSAPEAQYAAGIVALAKPRSKPQSVGHEIGLDACDDDWDVDCTLVGVDSAANAIEAGEEEVSNGKLGESTGEAPDRLGHVGGVTGKNLPGWGSVGSLHEPLPVEKQNGATANKRKRKPKQRPSLANSHEESSDGALGLNEKVGEANDTNAKQRDRMHEGVERLASAGESSCAVQEDSDKEKSGYLETVGLGVLAPRAGQLMGKRKKRSRSVEGLQNGGGAKRRAERRKST